MPSDNNDIINRPFADLQERMAEVDRLRRSDDVTNRREVDYRAICNYLNSEIFHLISSVDDPQVCLLYTSPSPRDATLSRMPSSA